MGKNCGYDLKEKFTKIIKIPCEESIVIVFNECNNTQGLYILNIVIRKFLKEVKNIMIENVE